MSGRSKTENKLAKIFDPLPNSHIEVVYQEPNLESAKYVRVYDDALGGVVVQAEFSEAKSIISVTILHYPTPNVVVPFTRHYEVSPQPWAPIHEVLRHCILFILLTHHQESYSSSHVKDFYAKLWFGGIPDDYPKWGIRDTFRGSKVTLYFVHLCFCLLFYYPDNC